MKSYIVCAAVLFSLSFFSCAKTAKEQVKMIPSDYLFAQRSFPYGKIDVSAYRSAIKTKKLEAQRSSFDKPWTPQGPTNICGRITDIEMPPNDTMSIYAGTASGGIFLSEDRGQSWIPIFDEVNSLSIGDMAISKQNPDLLYVGTGEANAGGGSLAYDGLGVYRSDNGGEDWNAIGLENVGSIGRVVIDPSDDNTVFVAAMGALFKNSQERGIYRTTDAGVSWKQVLFRSDSTGGIDLAIHPNNGKIIYAAMWERIRKPHNRQYGGETSGLYKSIDGGDTWEEMTGGLPETGDQKGRIGIAISESHPDILYAYYANAIGNISGIYKTEDGGASWVAKSIENISNVSFIWWFGKIFIHPTDPDEVYVTSTNLFRSTNGGEEWGQVFNTAHVDHHAMYIHPQKPDYVLNGNDGGVYAGLAPDYEASSYLNGISNFQFYTCKIDPNDPNIIYGGAQDNGTNKFVGDIDGWRSVGGGDGFRVIVDPNDSQQIYMESQYGGIRVSSDGGISSDWGRTGLDGDFNWNTPLAIDPNNTSVLYTGSQNLYRTIDKAQSWEAISPSLVNTDNPQGNLTFGSLTTIDVSAHDSQVIYIGTDDGNVWVTKDAGSTYQNISNGIPRRWITAISHDPHNSSGVYLSVSGFRFGEAEAQVYYSENYGEEWTAIGSGLPDIPVNDIIADSKIRGLIYAATDIGVYFSFNKGNEWQSLGIGIPTVPVTDIDLNNDARLLAAATFGRGIYTYSLPEIVNTANVPDLNEIVVYPNPTSGIINIGSKEKIDMVRVLNNKGRTITSFTAGEIDLTGYVVGIYLLEIELKSREKVYKKVIVN